MTFATAGKKIDDRIEDFRRKVHEAVEGMNESLKSADRQGFDRALRLAALEARCGDHDHDPSDRIATAILAIRYAPPE